MTGVIYARYSSDNQREESIEGQIRECSAYAEKHGITIVKHYIDRTLSAKTDNRPELQHMIADALVDIQNKESTMLPSLNQQLKECEKSIQNMLNAIEAGIITPSTKERLQTLEARREEIKIAIMQEQLQWPKLTKDQIAFWISRYKHGDPNDLDYQRQIIDTLVNRIYVYDDKLVLTYNYKDGTESIILEDIQKAFGSDLSSIAPLPESLEKSRIPVFFYPLVASLVPLLSSRQLPDRGLNPFRELLFHCFSGVNTIRSTEDIHFIEEAVGIYGSGIKAGHKALDALPTQCGPIRNAEGIVLPHTASDADSSFMCTTEVHSLFGNVIDSAFKTVRVVNDPQKSCPFA